MSSLGSDPVNYSVQELEKNIADAYQKHTYWCEQALTHNFIESSEIDALRKQFDRQDLQKPEVLFGGDKQNRPLVVALFGGTGVGKSTLLNRMAGQEIARTGVERPTSREVTLFLHNSIEIKQLPSGFPVEKVNIRQHQDQTKKEILLIDMPDIDSVETENLQIVRDWVPYIDMLIYVVSPERYRDDRGWQFLLAEGYQHAWSFVVNQWEQGEQKVVEDFAALLQTAGFEQPLIFRTDCHSKSIQDDFDQLSKHLSSIANNHTINELNRRGVLNRLEELKTILNAQLQLIGKRDSFNVIDNEVEKLWSQTSADIHQSLDLTIQKAALKYAQKKISFFDHFRKGYTNNEVDSLQSSVKKITRIWNDRAQDLAQLILDKVLLAVTELELPTRPFKEQFARLFPQIEKKVELSIQEGLQSGLVNPGNRLHRLIHQLLGLMTTLLPVAALTWVAYKVISVFYSGTSEEYLGINFAIHSFLLVLVAWLIPFLLHKKSQPSLQKAARKGMQEGLNSGLNEIMTDLNSILNKNRKIQDQLLKDGELLLETCELIKPTVQEVTDPTISRMLQK